MDLQQQQLSEKNYFFAIPTSGNFSNSLDQDQAGQNVVPELDPNCLLFDNLMVAYDNILRREKTLTSCLNNFHSKYLSIMM